MARSNHIFTNFTAGELSPRLYGRVDLSKYNNGCKTLSNFLLHPHGGVSKRGGTMFIAKAKYADKVCRMLEFEYSVTQAYNLEIGENYIRYYYGQARAEGNTAGISDATKANPCNVEIVAHNLSTGDTICIEDVLGMTELNGNNYTVTKVDADNVTLGVDSTSFTTYISGGTAVVETVTTYIESELFNLDFAQSADTLYIVHKDHAPATLTRSTHWTWTLTDIAFDWGTTPSVPGAITGATNASPCVISQVAHGYSNGDSVVMSGFSGITELNVDTVRAVSQSFANYYSLAFVDSSAYGIYGEIESPYAITGATKANPCVITHVAHGYTTADEVRNDSVGGMVELNVRTLRAITVIDVDSYSLDGVDSSAYTTYTSGGKSHLQTDDISGVAGAVIASPWSAGDYPQSVCFYEQRIIYAGIPTDPQNIWGSVSGEYSNMGAGDGDASDSWSYRIASDNVNAILWLSPGEELVVGTPGGEFTASGSSGNPITPTNIRITRRSTNGSTDISPLRVSDVALYVQRAKRKILQFEYQFESDSFVSPDLTLLSEHITRGSVKQMAYQQEPYSMVWATLEDGALRSLTYQRDQEVVGWANHTLGGTSDAAGSDPVVESVSSIPGVDGTGFDEVWFSVQRWINGAAVRHIEVLQEGLDDEGAITSSYFLDCGLSGTITGTTVSGLDHLEGETVDVLFDGATHPSKVVASGSITLDYTGAATPVHVGYGYNADLETIGVEAGSIDGTAQGKIKRVNDMTARLYRTVGLQAGGSSATLDEVTFREPSDPMDEAVPLFSGDKRLAPAAGFGTEGSVYLRQPYPLPCEITAVVINVMVNN